MTFAEIITEEDRWIVAKARLEINITRRRLCQVLPNLITRLKEAQ